MGRALALCAALLILSAPDSVRAQDSGTAATVESHGVHIVSVTFSNVKDFEPSLSEGWKRSSMTFAGVVAHGGPVHVTVVYTMPPAVSYFDWPYTVEASAGDKRVFFQEM